jgi:Nucleotide exchange factor Fes1
MHGELAATLPLHAAILQEPSEADLMKAALLHLTATDSTEADKVDALLRLRDLVRPIDNANGGCCPLNRSSLAKD